LQHAALGRPAYIGGTTDLSNCHKTALDVLPGRALELAGFTGAINPAFPRQARAFPRLRRVGAPQLSAAGLPPGASSCRSPLQLGGKRAVALQGRRFETLNLCLIVDDAQGKRGGPMRQQVESGDLAG
jgi:hypothetical protein